MKENLFSIIKFLWENKEATIKQISKATNLDKSTISRYLKNLKGTGIIQTVGSLKQGPKGGRKTQIQSFNYNIFNILGLEIEQNGINCVVTNLKGDPIDNFRIKEKINKSNLVNMVQKIIEEKKDSNICACGISLPGIINSKEGMIVYSKALGIENFKLVSDLSKVNDIPFLIDNDSNVGAAYYNLKLKGSARNILYVYISIPYDIHDFVGVGIGIIINNHLYHGSNNCSGEYEFKLRLIEKNNGYVNDYYDFLNTHSEDEIFYEIKTFLSKLAREIGLLVGIIDPDTVIFDGGIKFLPEIAIKFLVEETRNNLFLSKQRNINFITEEKNEPLTAVGAAINFITKIFENKQYLAKIFKRQINSGALEIKWFSGERVKSFHPAG